MEEPVQQSPNVASGEEKDTPAEQISTETPREPGWRLGIVDFEYVLLLIFIFFVVIIILALLGPSVSNDSGDIIRNI